MAHYTVAAMYSLRLKMSQMFLRTKSCFQFQNGFFLIFMPRFVERDM